MIDKDGSKLLGEREIFKMPAIYSPGFASVYALCVIIHSFFVIFPAFYRDIAMQTQTTLGMA